MFIKICDCFLLVISHGTSVDRITVKANRVLGLVKRTCRDLKDVDSVRTLCCSLVRPYWNIHVKLGTLY